jgi:hypothetical protein
MRKRYKVYSVLDDGSKVPVKGRELIIDLGSGQELKISLVAEGGSELALYTEATETHSDAIVLRPGGGNLVYVALERGPGHGEIDESTTT